MREILGVTLILSEKGWDTFQALGDNAVLKGNLLFLTQK